MSSFQELQRRFTRDRIETYSDVILGLPGETYASFAEGVSAVIENGQHHRIQSVHALVGGGGRVTGLAEVLHRQLAHPQGQLHHLCPVARVDQHGGMRPVEDAGFHQGDLAAALLEHVGNSGPGAVDGAGEVGVDDGLPAVPIPRQPVPDVRARSDRRAGPGVPEPDLMLDWPASLSSVM